MSKRQSNQYQIMEDEVDDPLSENSQSYQSLNPPLLGHDQDLEKPTKRSKQDEAKYQRREAITDVDKFRRQHKKVTADLAMSWVDPYNTRQHQIFRGITCVLAIAMMIYSLIPGGWQLNEGECMRDYTFNWTDGINRYLRAHLGVRNAWMIYAGCLMDGYLALMIYANHKKSFLTIRMIWSFLAFYGVRALVQQNFILGRQEGFLWFYPGFPSLTVTYIDMNDFYYSGHVGSTLMCTLELYFQGRMKLVYIGMFVHINMWFLLNAVRTHYAIDLITAFLLAHQAMMFGERLCYFSDVKICGWAGKDRRQHAYTPCHECGWSNSNYEISIHNEEKVFLDKTARLRKNRKIIKS